jgi:Family of unknown function (DUF6526)
MPEQTYANHTKYVPLYHFVLFGLGTVNLVWTLVRLFMPVEGVPLPDRLWAVVMALVLLGVGLYARIFALGAQDRIIRLEERLRYDAVLPADLRARAGELRRSQVIALRFAGDGELPDLVRNVLDGKITSPKEIKLSIRSWRADHFRL